jgi:hypothetical protein
MNLKLLLVTTLSLTLLSSEAFAFGSKPTALTDESGRFVVAGNVPKNQSKLLLQDLQHLHALSMRSTDEELLQLMELNEANAGTLSQWLAARVQYVVGEELDLEKAVYLAAERHPYENPSLMPELELPSGARPFMEPAGGTKPVTVMSNLGTALYTVGKMQGVLIGFRVPGSSSVSISSPRTGIIQIGEGHFLPMMKRFGLPGANLESEAYKLFRLATLFHEARHSDGHGKSLGFAHALCPAGHDYAGTNACDRNLNGPYTVGALITRNLLQNCATCSAAEKEALKLEALDSFSRVIRETVRNTGPGERAEEEICRILRDLNRDLSTPTELPDLCKDVTPREPGRTVIPSTFWDPRPEGRR